MLKPTSNQSKILSAFFTKYFKFFFFTLIFAQKMKTKKKEIKTYKKAKGLNIIDIC